MKKSLKIPYHPLLAGKAMGHVNAMIDHVGVKIQIDSVNWPDVYAHQPEVTVYLARTDEHLFVKWHVVGQNVKAIQSEDFAHVHLDSCVEFFCQLPNKEHYINFEFNAIGIGTASRRKGRKDDVTSLSADEFQSVLRYASLGNQPFEEVDGLCTWTVCVGIPLSLIEVDSAQLSSGAEPFCLRGNFYKCGDETAYPHFVSWNPILTEKPDFHRPEYFAELYF